MVSFVNDLKDNKMMDDVILKFLEGHISMAEVVKMVARRGFQETYFKNDGIWKKVIICINGMEHKHLSEIKVSQ